MSHVKCLSTIFCQIADPPLLNHGFLSSPSDSSPRDEFVMWSPQCDGEATWAHNDFEPSMESSESCLNVKTNSSVDTHKIMITTVMTADVYNSLALVESTVSGEASGTSPTAANVKKPVKRKRNLTGMPDSDAELHKRGHNLPWKLKQRTSKEIRKRVYVCPEPSCVHDDPSRALGDLTGIKKHFCRKHGEKKWKCEQCGGEVKVVRKEDMTANSKNHDIETLTGEESDTHGRRRCPRTTLDENFL
ncbi:hypothetical protein Tco_0481767 [Tanacetum coccineum]